METLSKVQQLENRFDVCGGSKKDGMGFIYDATTPRGKCPLFKTLLSNKCSYDCKYCTNSKKTRQTNLSFEPNELAKTFIHMQRKYLLEGLFLSSAVDKDVNAVTEKMIEVVKQVRFLYSYKGYIHFKVLPGVSYHLVKEVSPLVNRMSINIEAPSKSHLDDLSSMKDYKIDILRRQRWVTQLHDNQTTQLIIGAGDETDLEVLKMAEWEYKIFELKRIYYSSFKQCKNIGLKKESAPALRSIRLYNVDFLLRKYNYKVNEFKEILSEEDMLPKQDPKMLIAINNFSGPIDVNDTSYEELLRVPGIGPKTANKILNKKNKIKKYADLQNIGVILKRAKPFIEVNGKRQKMLMEFK